MEERKRGVIQMTDKKIIALYARVSTGRQEQEATIESQLDEIKRKVAEEGYILANENVFIDDGWPGEFLARPALDQMRDAAQAEKFETLFVYDLGRLSRDFKNLLILLDDLQTRQVKVISLHDINAESDEQIFARNVMGLFHDYERKKIAERMRRGKLYKARQGLVISGQALYGYTYVKKTDTSPTCWEINERESEVVEMIFKWFVRDGLSLHAIIQRLSDLGIPTKKGKSKYWTKGPVSRILCCETYFTGIAYFNKSEAVVSKRRLKNEKYFKVKKNSRRKRPREEWIPFEVPVIFNDKSPLYKSTELLSYNKKFAHKNKKFDYLLSGKMFCEHGFPMVGDGVQGNQRYYRSSDKVRTKELRTCDCDGVNVYVLEGLWWNHTRDVLANPDYIRTKIKEYAESRSTVSSQLEQEIYSLKDRIENLKEQETKFAQMYAEKLIDIEQLKGLLKQSGNKKIGLKKQLKELEKKTLVKTSVTNEEIEQLYIEAQKALKSQDFTDKKLVLKELISKITIKKGGMVETCINIPLSQYLEHEPESRYCWSS